MTIDREKEIEGKCDKCIFSIHYTSDGNLMRVCRGIYPIIDEEAHSRIIKSMEGEECNEYEEGHEEWLKMKESGLSPCRYFVNTPPQEKYRLSKEYSDKPVFACSSWEPCNCGEGNPGIGCFWKVTGCSSQMRLDNPSKMANVDMLRDAFEKAGIDTSKIDYLN